MSDRTRSWMIKRNCSASPRQLALVFASIVAVSFSFGVVFAAHGLWLVLPFVGLELLAVLAAFLCYGRRAADFERIEISGGEISVERIEAGRRSVRRLPVPWTQVLVQSRQGGRLSPVCVSLAARGERVEIGGHLLDAKRLHLAEELRCALRQATPA